MTLLEACDFHGAMIEFQVKPLIRFDSVQTEPGTITVPELACTDLFLLGSKFRHSEST